MTRGRVLGLSPAQIAARAKYLGNLDVASSLDAFVTNPAHVCVDGYYLLHEHNGGKDPTAGDPFERWVKPDEVDEHGNRIVHTFVNRTGDCIGGASWCGGFDRYQPLRFAHLYDGWINTDSMIMDAIGPARCFVRLKFPEPGCFMVAPTGAPGFEKCGHIATVWAAPPAEHFDHDSLDSWRHVLAVDVALRSPDRANAPTTGAVWFHARETPANAHHFAIFCRSIMEP